MSRAAITALAVGVLVVAVVAGLALDGKPVGEDVPARGEPTPRAPGDAEQLRALVVRRARALGDARPRALARTAVAGRRARERREARRAGAIGVRAVRAQVGQPTIRGDRATVPVRLTYRIRGVAGRFTADRRVRAVRRPGGWRVRGEGGARRRAPWEVAAFRRVHSRHFVVLAPPGVDPVAGGLLTALENGYGRMRELLARGRLRRRYLTVVAADAGQARALTAGIRGLDRLAALTDTEVRETGRERRVRAVLSQRLIVVWPNFAEAGPEQGATVVRHELTHAVLAPYTSGRTPAWLTEGVALYVSDDRRVHEAAVRLGEGGPVARVMRLRALEGPEAIARLNGERQSAAYAYASAAAFHIVEHYGRDALLDLYDAFNDPDVADADAAMRRVLAIRRAVLDRRIRDWILERAAVAPYAP